MGPVLSDSSILRYQRSSPSRARENPGPLHLVPALQPIK